MQRYLPWKTEGLAPLIGTMVTWGLIEAIRTGFFAAYLPYAAKASGLGLSAVGIAFTLNFLADSLFRGPGGYLVSRIGLGWMVTLAASATLLVMLALPWYGAAWALWLASVVWGICLSAVNPGMMTLSSRLAQPGREGRALTYTGTLIAPFIGLGWIGGNALVQQEVGIAAAGWALMALAVVAVLTSLPALFIRENLHFGKQELYPWRKLLIFLPAAFGQTFAPNLVGLVLAKYADTQLGLAFWQQAVLLGLGGAVVLVGTGILGRIPDRRGPRYPLVIGVVLVGLAMLGLAQKPGFSEILLLALLGGCGMALFGPSWNALVVRLLPQQNRAGIWGTLMLFEGLGYGLGPTAGTFLWETFNPTTPFLLSGVIWLMLAVFYWLALRGKSWKS